MRSKLSKKAANNKHCKKRALNRFDIKLNKIGIKQIVSCIQEKREEVTFIKKLTNTRSVWQLTLNGKIAKAIYDKKSKSIVTFLKEEHEV